MEIRHKHSLIWKYDTHIIWYGNTTLSYFHIRLCLCRISISDYVCVVYPYQIMFGKNDLQNTTQTTLGWATWTLLKRGGEFTCFGMFSSSCASNYVCVVFPYQTMFVSYFHIRLCFCHISISDYVCVIRHKHNLIWKYDTNIIWYGNTTQT
jgi:hypothetical protein